MYPGTKDLSSLRAGVQAHQRLRCSHTKREIIDEGFESVALTSFKYTYAITGRFSVN